MVSEGREHGHHDEPSEDAGPVAPGSEHGDSELDTSTTPEHGTGSEPQLAEVEDGDGSEGQGG